MSVPKRGDTFGAEEIYRFQLPGERERERKRERERERELASKRERPVQFEERSDVIRPEELNKRQLLVERIHVVNIPDKHLCVEALVRALLRAL